MEQALDRACLMMGGMEMERNMPLSELTSFRIGGPAALVVHPRNAGEIGRVIGACGACGVPYRVLGNGTNVLAPDDGFPGVILRMDMPGARPVFSGTLVTAEACASLAALARTTVEKGLMGMEQLSGIPGTVGGAVAMNAGAYGVEMRHIVKSVRILSNGEVRDVAVCGADFGNRTSRFCAPEVIVLSATLQLAPDDGGAMERMEACGAARRAKQPLAYPSAGSVFKRPEGMFAGSLIEACGLKGESVGGARVSPKHAGFIINTGGATERDVLELVRRVQARVYEQTGVRLERELKLLSEV